MLGEAHDDAPREGSIGRPIALLSAAGFASVASMRVADPLVPQVARSSP
jgi:hypothetical protein